MIVGRTLPVHHHGGMSLGLMGLLTTILTIQTVIVCSSSAHDSVQKLTEKNFDEALADPANGLWLLKFYAPWCGHCKKLAPVLDKVAPHIKGKMAIGKVDCTTEKSLCSRFEVKSFPTMKFARDGEYYDFPGERSADSIIDFAELMSRPPVASVRTHAGAYDDVAALHRDGVAFLAYDPDAKGENVEEILGSTTMLQVFGQVARKRQAYASFAILEPDIESEEVAGFGDLAKPFIIKIEKDVTPVAFTGDITTPNLMEFIKNNNLPIITNLGAHNFHKLGHMGKHLGIMVLDPEQTERQSVPFLKQLKDYAISGSRKDNYIFGTIDGRRWERFMNQFEIDIKNLPEFFILDVPNRLFWQDTSILTVEEFVAAKESGQISSRSQGSKSGPGVFGEFKDVFMFYLPYSAICVAIMFIMFYYIFSIPDEEVEAPPENKDKKKKKKKSEDKETKKD
eukprot:CAMPEP_0172488576 /NCGR_PEP_ID=MMETSP1066-20121228/18170_1 /TAXON_ID=671091 /ORGANISM="Coscinodiscus wailesii, Strain CCMP2513" /LENGTH=451 /DNA_ID=CAMNT_0013255889 /DNA_START=169 /DNA_END=1524 /DNA_ORIENTATION=+